MRLLVCGDRHWKDRDYLFTVLDDIHRLYDVRQVIEGCATGADRLTGWPCPVELRKGEPEPLLGWATERGIPVDHNPADWAHLGKPAGPMRNITMLSKEPDMVVAFHRSFNASKGTKHMVGIARAAGVQVHIFPHHTVDSDHIAEDGEWWLDAIKSGASL